MTQAHEYQLLAIKHPTRGESLNVGLMLWAEGLPRIFPATSAQRLAALDPNLPRLPVVAALLDGSLQDRLHAALQQQPDETGARQTLLGLLLRPIVALPPAQIFAADSQELQERIGQILDLYVRRPALQVKAAHRPAKRASRLYNEIKLWLKQHHAFSTRVEDISEGKVVAHYPVNPQSGLYADLAVMNGALHAVEVLDLRGAQHLTPTLRGEAAIKGITLDAAREHLDGRRIAVVSASDYAVARPAISLISRYADDLIDMTEPSGRQRLADFIAGALHRTDLPSLELTT
ncbi:hypothetical protein MOJ79_16940 [Calidifontimicrobium sp. SYSU G02091]|uniref:hypothetical protein n=1 Tax=Calidifontimicrobium sp. SYSU G02091 TaxID=2926421 RepID=UPI001F52D79D|nr:hypothetical protein [Calidifontimicrobium sp. SYSU G02091]MCI1193520.1 hypothetical protein [Calidifontimicrobium sp. SYSU G02091]